MGSGGDGRDEGRKPLLVALALAIVLQGLFAAFISMTAAPTAPLSRRLPALAAFSLVGGAMTDRADRRTVFDAIHFTFVSFMGVTVRVKRLGENGCGDRGH